MARCKGVDPDIFFNPTRYGAARIICSLCPVRINCLKDALKFDADSYFADTGIWAGYTPQERLKIRKRNEKE